MELKNSVVARADGFATRADRTAARSQLRALATKDHGIIQRWAERHNAEPATGEATPSGPATLRVTDGGAGIRFNFPGIARFRQISWTEWFDNFDLPRADVRVRGGGRRSRLRVPGRHEVAETGTTRTTGSRPKRSSVHAVREQRGTGWSKKIREPERLLGSQRLDRVHRRRTPGGYCCRNERGHGQQE